jgi:alkylated DNA repair dioxygenase AlkB
MRGDLTTRGAAGGQSTLEGTWSAEHQIAHVVGSAFLYVRIALTAVRIALTEQVLQTAKRLVRSTRRLLNVNALSANASHRSQRSPSTGRSKRTSTPWIEVDSVPGFIHKHHALTGGEQDQLVRSINAEQARWENDYTRWRQYYAYRYDYNNDTLSEIDNGALPEWLISWAHVIYARGWMSTLAEQVTVQKYNIGSVMGPHRDSSRCFGPEIVTISLLSSCDFRLVDAKSRQMLCRRLDAGDVVVLRGQARTIWRHEVLKHNPAYGGGPDWRRLSVVFRTVNPERIRYR